MKRSSKKMIAVMATVASLVGQAAPVAACGRGGGGGYGGGFGGRVYSQPSVSYAQPSYSSSSYGYAQPGYAQPSYGQSSYGQPSYGQPAGRYPSTTTMQSNYGGVPQRVLSAAPRQQPMATGQSTGQASMMQNQATQAQPVSSRLNRTPSAASMPQAANPSSTAANPQAQSQASQAVGSSRQTSTANAQTTATPEQSALQMLASIATTQSTTSENAAVASEVPQFAPPTNSAASQSQPAHVGTWTATLPNNAMIQLQLDAEGEFSWMATQKGKTSTFAGQYSVDGGRLTLVRGGDRQELKGSWKGDIQSGFNFKLDGAKDAGLDFRKS